ncbi:NADH-cytochrome b5 reductase 1 [Coccidioides immitis RS]|uniref:NADH-cytochrome b5 reductase 1 n=4 Tax=Coccidioides TaxID=5500 RepID=NCB5R_COCIM|nr:NADH-cytochrome b5 reductase 1 [Coccidioides immitis RS]XP_003067574.1 oxidoreductase, FAD-binding family protein [Coccidioides posadasii C735 delta SOWgp]Q1DWN4.1 RecName: Full=NADH-cytochrome b5 reductase 1; AltName: Full=Microsomal cytochrome b reductase [Coccidioides immitis RS]EFW17593.1 NADH-cytochrome b5 reductase 1 [Coccidioides posadasii str. Silveira]KMM70765.1 nitrate reductase 2 [Coccidioides posadasii RMSCC 3488]EAS34255.3 NADH-cytochrome b5 reductase 1 [Coccidioides immitis RS|eukprot:XP_003067574.1 oxidoreductase, FAD-binding family protein [Coccidioides posadasii C735 delta SOWgp]
MSSWTSKENINGVYIPSALLIFGTTIIKKEWIAYATALAVVLSAWKLFSNKPRKVLNPTEFQNFVLKDKTIVSHNVCIYRFALPRPTDILGLPIGQHISLAATIPGQSKEIVRSYTPISSDDDAGYFDLLVKSYPQGNISKHLTTLRIGDKMKVRGPKGAMVYTPNMVRHIGMIAGGTGITPMLQVIKAIIKGRPRNGGNDTTQIDLIFANVNPDDILLKEELDQLAKEDDAFRIYYVLNNPPEKWNGGVGFVTPDMIKAKLPAPAGDIKVLICGPPPMVSAMKKATESLGYKKANLVSKLEDQVFCF